MIVGFFRNVLVADVTYKTAALRTHELVASSVLDYWYLTLWTDSQEGFRHLFLDDMTFVDTLFLLKFQTCIWRVRNIPAKSTARDFAARVLAAELSIHRWRRTYSGKVAEGAALQIFQVGLS